MNALVPRDKNSVGSRKLAAVLSAGLGVTTKALGVGGASIDKISLKGNRFTQIVGGQTLKTADTLYLDVIMIGTAESVGRMYFEAGYDPDNAGVAPTCVSTNGKVPNQSSAAPQSSRCDLCPKNIAGSGQNGRGKACNYIKPIVVLVHGDDQWRPYRLDVKAMSLFGDSYPEKREYSLIGYASALAALNYTPTEVITRLSFDANASVPKLLFKPIEVLSDEYGDIVSDVLSDKDARIKELLKLSNDETTLDGDAPVRLQGVAALVQQRALPAPAAVAPPAAPPAATPTRAAPAAVALARTSPTPNRTALAAAAPKTAPAATRPAAVPATRSQPAAKVAVAPVSVPAAPSKDEEDMAFLDKSMDDAMDLNADWNGAK